jgi:hypothetical protein
MARFGAVLLWLVLACAIVLVAAMTWHPWVHPWTGITHAAAKIVR